MIRRFLAAAALLATLSGCGAAPSLPPTAAPAVHDIGQSVIGVAGGAYDGQQVTILAPILQRPQSRIMFNGLSLVGGLPAPLIAQQDEAVRLEGAPVSGLISSPAGEYGVVRASGSVALGADGVRSLTPSDVKVIAPVPLRLADLTVNPTVYEGQVVEVTGTLLFKADQALLVEAVEPGGLPALDAEQLKIAQPFADQSLVDSLHSGSGGTVRYGRVGVVGVWRKGQITVFWANRGPEN